MDDRGKVVALERPATRLAPLYGGITDMLVALGLEERIVARTAADDAPRLREIPAVGTHMRPNVEMLVGMDPDLVLQMGGRKDASRPLEAVERHGIATAFFLVRDFEDMFSVLRRVGALTGASDTAEDLIARMRGRLDAVAGVVAGAPRPRVFFEVRYPNLLCAGQGSIVDAVIRAAGGRNAIENKDKLVRLNEEALLALNPEVCLSQRGPMNQDPAPFAERPHFRTLDCVRTGRALVVDERLYSRPGPASVEAVERLARLLHPQASWPAAVDAKGGLQ